MTIQGICQIHRYTVLTYSNLCQAQDIQNKFYILKTKSNFTVLITEYLYSCFDLIKISLVSKTCPSIIQER